MKRSPMNTPYDPTRQRHTPYNWNSHENGNRRGYQSVKNGSYQSSSVNDALQTCGDDFIPLNISTPVTQYKKHSGNWRSPGAGRNNASAGSRGYNYRNNHYATPGSSYNNSYSPYKYSGRQFHNRRKRDKGAHRHVNISEYIDASSFLEDPWESLLKKLNDSRSTSESKAPKIEFPSNTGLIASDAAEKFESRLSKGTNVDDSQCSEESKIESSADASFGAESSKGNSSVDLEIGGICFNQDSLDENTSSNNDNTPKVIEEEGKTHSDGLVTDTDKKNI